MSEKLYLLADKILHSAFYILFFAIPLIFTPWNFELFEFNKMMLTYALAVVIVACWAVKCIIAGRLIFRRTLLFLPAHHRYAQAFVGGPLLLFLLSQILSTIGSIDIHTSIFGYYTRSHGGLLSTVTYIFLYWALVSNMTPEAVIKSVKYLLSSALIVSVWGILEHFGRSPSCLILTGSFDASCWVQDVQNRVFATLGQPNWMAAFLVAVMPLAWTAAILNIKNKKLKIHIKNKKFWVWLGITSLLFIAILYTKSRSGLLGFLIAYMIFWLLVFIYNRAAWLSQAIKAFLIFTFLFLSLALALGTPWTPSVIDILNPAPETRNLTPDTGTVLERGGTESGEIRKIVWKGAVDIWRAYPLFGSGVETFAYSYYNFRSVEHNLTSEWNFLYNKAHNEYLNFLATTGASGLVTYFLLIAAFLWWGFSKIKNTDQKLKNFDIYILHFALLAGFASILVTNFFGFSVVPVAILFFLYPAIVRVLNDAEQNAEASGNISTNQRLNQHKSAFNLPKILQTLGVLVIGGYLLTRLSQLWYSDTLFNQADKLIKSDEPARNATQSVAGGPAQAAEKLEKAIRLNSGEPNYHDKLATAYSTLAATLAEEDKTQDAKKFADLAKQETDKAYAISPRNISLLKSRASTFNRLASVDPIYLTYTLITLERAATFAPTDPITNYNFAVALFRTGDTKSAIETFEKLNRMKPDYTDSHFALAEIYLFENQKQKAKGELEYILKNIDPNSEPVKTMIEKLSK